MFKTKFLQCTSIVNPNAITRSTIDGIEHIIVSSFTLPSNIVMNGVLYPKKEIDSTFLGLNRTLAPVEHPTNSDGQFISANDPEAINNFYAGTFNDNAKKVGNRISVDKVINVQEALKSQRGKRLLDRIEELETSSNPRPIHTSTGIFLEIEELAEPQMNEDGLEYGMIAHNMVFDHDAILLDSVGAAQPHQGVGMAVNDSGEKIDVDVVSLDVKDNRVNQEGLSHSNLVEQLSNEVEGTVSAEWMYIEDVFDDVFILHTDVGFFEVPYRVDGDRARVTGIPIRVERVVSYQPKTNSKKESKMEELILNALKEAGVDVKDMTDDEKLNAYKSLLSVNSETDDDEEVSVSEDIIANAVADAIKSLQESVASLKAEISANAESSKAEIISVISGSAQYPGLDDETLSGLPVEKLKKMAANCGNAHGLPLNINEVGADDKNSAPTEMPE